MLIRGLDFTSSALAKQNVLVEGELADGCLRLRRAESLPGGPQTLGTILSSVGPWVLGIDFPFGLPNAFLREVGWGERWEDYVKAACSLDKTAFVESIRAFRDGKPDGQKQPKRHVDRLARSLSPLMTDGTPIAKMFWAGASHLADCSCDVLPFRMTGSDRVVVEAYPALVARRLLGGNKYKDGKGDGRTREARETMVALIQRGALDREFGFRVSVDAALGANSVADDFGDVLDSALCAVQVAWAYTQRQSQWGIPKGNEIEGWIVDPALVRQDSDSICVAIPESSSLPCPPKRSFNSSKTRVQPVFRTLLRSDPVGTTWLPNLLKLAIRNRERATAMAASAGAIQQPSASVDGSGENAHFERTFAPPREFLRWCLEHPENLSRPRTADMASEGTRKRRAAFLQVGSPESQSLQREGLNALSAGSVAQSAKQWWAFEGFTSVDFCAETDSLILFVEGKRLEPVSGTVSWVEQRNQVARNLEVAAQYAAAKNLDYAVLVIGPDGVLVPSDRELKASWPNLSETKQHELLDHFLGATTWRTVCEATGIAYDSLPLTAANAVKVRMSTSESDR